MLFEHEHQDPIAQALDKWSEAKHQNVHQQKYREGDVKNDTVHGFLTCCYDD